MILSMINYNPDGGVHSEKTFLLSETFVLPEFDNAVESKDIMMFLHTPSRLLSKPDNPAVDAVALLLKEDTGAIINRALTENGYIRLHCGPETGYDESDPHVVTIDARNASLSGCDIITTDCRKV